MRLLEISNTYRVLNSIEPTPADVCAVHNDPELTSEWVGRVPYAGSGLYDPDTEKYLLRATLQSTGRIEWVDAVPNDLPVPFAE
jgi:hypothetical protein